VKYDDGSNSRQLVVVVLVLVTLRISVVGDVPLQWDLLAQRHVTITTTTTTRCSAVAEKPAT